MAMLANIFSHKTVNDFFKIDKKAPSRKIRNQIKKTSLEKKLSPLLKEHFSFQNWNLFIKDMTEAYFNYWLNEASLQKSSPEPVLFKSHICPEMSESETEIFFLRQFRH